MTDKQDATEAQSLAADLTLEEVVGQLICASVGHHSDGAYAFSDSLEATKALIQDLKLGGICYFPVGERGVEPDRIKEVCDELQDAAAKAGVLPLVTSVDQEGGLVARMQEPATRWPSAMALAAGGDWDAVREVSYMLGAQLRAVGLNQTYAPVADVNTEPRNPIIGIRSASSSPAVVAAFDHAAIRGFQQVPIASCVKHFPGHGDTQVDSHVGLPVLGANLEQWRKTEAVPFRAAIEAGVDSVMVGHLVAPGLDPSGERATFSRQIVTGLLREELGFQGVIVTDALDMAGAQLTEGGGAACVAALKAGIDQLLMPRDPRACVEAVLAAVASGELDEADLRASARRILAMKQKAEILPLGATTEHALVEDIESHHRHAASAIARSLTWRDGAHTFAAEGPVVVVAAPVPPSEGRGIEDVPAQIAAELEDRGVEAQVVALEEFVEHPDQVTGTEPVLVVHDAWRDEDVSDAILEATERGEFSAVVAARSPYDSAVVAEETPLLLTYGEIPGVGAKVAGVITGEDAPGVLPVDLPAPSGEILWTRELEEK